MWPYPDHLDAVIAAPAHHAVILENEHVRVLDTRVPAGATVPLHTHRWPGVLHVISWSDVIRRDEHGTVTLDSRALETPLPRVMWSPALAPHTLENVGTADVHIISVEIKG